MIPQILVAAVSIGTASCASVSLNGVESDTIAVLGVTIEHHFEARDLNSVALDMETALRQGRLSDEDEVRELAGRVGLPLARRSEVYTCEERSGRRPWCRLMDLEHLVGVRLDSMDGDRAEVAVWSWHEWREGSVDAGGAAYELMKVDGEWIIHKKLMDFAT